jgi:hypothetical protein
MAVITDSFTDTNGTLLQAHVGGTGETWTKTPFFSSDGDADIQSNHVELDASNTALQSNYRWNLSDQVSEASLTLTFTFSNTTGARPFVALSQRGGVTNSYVTLERLVGGANEGKWNLTLGSNFGTAYSGYDDGLPHTLKLEQTTAGVLKAYIDGVLKQTNTPGGLSDRGTVRFRFGATGSTGGSPQFDTISIDVTTFAAGLAPTVTLGPLTSVITRARTLGAITADAFLFLTGPHHNSQGTPSTQGGSSGGTPPPITGQLWPRGQKSG